MSVDTLPTEKTNGKAHHQSGGRAVPEMTFTFKDTGRSVRIKQKVSPYVNEQLRKRYERDHPEPQPPTVRIPIDDQGAFIDEPNYNDETYKARKQRYNQDLQAWIGDRLVEYVVNVCVDPGEIDQEAVDNHKQFFGNDDGDSDVQIYVKYICPGSMHDLGELVQFVTARSQPTQEQIQEKVSTFRGDVSE